MKVIGGALYFMWRKEKRQYKILVFLIVGTFKCFFKGLSYKGLIRVLIYSNFWSRKYRVLYLLPSFTQKTPPPNISNSLPQKATPKSPIQKSMKNDIGEIYILLWDFLGTPKSPKNLGKIGGLNQ
jgi:hypothetical protein